MPVPNKTTRADKRDRRHRRIRSRVSGVATRPRICVYRSNTGVSLQLIDDVAGRTLASATTKEVKSGSLLEKAKKAGTLLAERARALKVAEAVFDRSGYVYTGKVRAAAEGAREGGLRF